MPPHRAERRRRFSAELDPYKILIAVIVFGSALYLAWFSFDNRRITECQAEFNADVARITQTRAAIAAEERQAQVDFLLKLARAGENDAASARAFQTYINQVSGFEERRKRNPIPQLEARKCD